MLTIPANWFYQHKQILNSVVPVPNLHPEHQIWTMFLVLVLLFGVRVLELEDLSFYCLCAQECFLVCCVESGANVHATKRTLNMEVGGRYLSKLEVQVYDLPACVPHR